MGCGGSRANAFEPRYCDSWTRETESTWLTNTDTEVPQLDIINNQNQGNTGSDIPGLKESAATWAGKGSEEKQANAGSWHRQKKMVNAGTQCEKEPLSSSTSTDNQRGLLRHEEMRPESKIRSSDEVPVKITKCVQQVDKAGTPMSGWAK